MYQLPLKTAAARQNSKHAAKGGGVLLLPLAAACGQAASIAKCAADTHACDRTCSGSEASILASEYRATAAARSAEMVTPSAVHRGSTKRINLQSMRQPSAIAERSAHSAARLFEPWFQTLVHGPAMYRQRSACGALAQNRSTLQRCGTASSSNADTKR